MMRLLALLFRERLAALAHDGIWATWTRYQFSKCRPYNDGTLEMPAWAVERWTRQANTPYCELPESERASDREQADKMIAVLCGGDWREWDS
ncbi:MAG: hypothetical protein IT323_13480 [Anaerolineae bacterium]|nr:hypothetical protein [Anaerolineae bacterium]